jgi:3-dehydroquinate synthase
MQDTIQNQILITSNISSLKNELCKILANKHAVVITEKNLARHYLVDLKEILSCTAKLSFFILESGEHSKSFNILHKLLEDILANNPDRQAFVVSFGGGMITDLATMAANPLLRGLNLMHIPTSLIAQVDSAIGGKGAVNSKHGKNLIGSFYQPSYVLINILFLKTLPKDELISGYAEIVKYAAIKDKKFFLWLSQNSNFLAEYNPEKLRYIVEKCVKMKSELVAHDINDKLGIRALLNFGHSFAHAIEAELNYNIKHGEAVSVGMVLASELSAKLGYLDIQEVGAIADLLSRLNLPTRISGLDAGELLRKMQRDKKMTNGSLNLVLLREIGYAFLAKQVDEEIIGQVLVDTI